MNDHPADAMPCCLNPPTPTGLISALLDWFSAHPRAGWGARRSGTRSLAAPSWRSSRCEGFVALLFHAVVVQLQGIPWCACTPIPMFMHGMAWHGMLCPFRCDHASAHARAHHGPPCHAMPSHAAPVPVP